MNEHATAFVNPHPNAPDQAPEAVFAHPPKIAEHAPQARLACPPPTNEL